MNARMIAAAPMLLLALTVAGCKDEPEPAPVQQGSAKAEGDVKGGTISDAMIPMEKLKSKSPALKVKPKETGSTDSGKSEDEAEDKVE